MSKFLIYQHYYKLEASERTNIVLDDDNGYYELSKQSIREYAKKYGHDYLHIEKKHKIYPFYSIFNPFHEGWCDDYDAICWIDTDVLATRTSKDIFEHISFDDISAYFMDTYARWRKFKPGTPGEWFKDKGHINSGIVVFPRKRYEFIKTYVEDLEALHDACGEYERLLGSFDQAIINKIVRELESYHILDGSFNYHLGRRPHEDRFDQSLIHYWRKYKPMLIDDFEDERILK